jgi:predicted RND superfamily exporter protein
VHRRIEQALEALGHVLYRRAWWVIAVAALAIGLGASQIPRIEIKVSTDDFLDDDDPVNVVYDDFLERFGRDDMMILAIEPPEIFDLAFLEGLRALHEELEEGVPHVREVQSLVNARETRGEDDRLIVGELLEDWPASAAELASLRDRALANPLYSGLILSENGRLTTVTIELEAFSELYDSDDALAGFDELDAAEESQEPAADDADKLTGQQEFEAVAAVDEIIARYDAPDFRIYAGGAPIINSDMMGSMIRDIVLFTGLSVCVIAIVLTVVFRRAVGVAIPLGVAILALLSTLGAMGTLGIPAMPISEIVPSFLLSVGVGGTVHLLVIFQQRLRAGASREDAIAGALGHSGLPIIMTSLTTAGGLASFAAAQLVPVAIFGTVAPLGILLTLLLTLLLSPALLAVVPLRSPRDTSDRRPPSIRLLTRMGGFAIANARQVLIACTLLLLAAGVGMMRLEFSFNSLDWFPDDLPARVASKKLDAELGGGMALEVLIDTGSENGLHDPELLVDIDRARHVLADLQVGDVVAGKSVSLIDVVKEIHQALNGGRPEAHAIPDERQLVSQELLLFENSGSDDLEDVVDSRFSVGRFTMRVPFVDGSQYGAFGDEVERIFDERLAGRAEASLTGLMVVMGRTFVAVIETMARAYTIALVVITPLMMLLLGSFRLGLIAMIPNLFPIALTLGLMGWAGVRLEMFSLLIGSVALGLAVDDTIHFMHGFRRGYARSGDVARAVRETLETTGQALLFTSIVLSLGFFIYVFSELTSLTNFGLLTAFAIVTAFLADVLMAPALMSYLARYSSISTRKA